MFVGLPIMCALAHMIVGLIGGPQQPPKVAAAEGLPQQQGAVCPPVHV